MLYVIGVAKEMWAKAKTDLVYTHIIIEQSRIIDKTLIPADTNAKLTILVEELEYKIRCLTQWIWAFIVIISIFFNGSSTP